MNILLFAQTLFYFTVSLAIIAFAVIAILFARYCLRVMASLERVAENMGDTSEDIKESIREMIEKLASIPFVSFLFKRRKEAKTEKAEKKSTSRKKTEEK